MNDVGPVFSALFDEQTVSPVVNGLVVSLSLLVSGVGVAIIAWGAYSSVLRLIAWEAAVSRGRMSLADAANGRVMFATYLIPGLDFLTAGCVIKTLMVPDWQQAALLASLVFARTLLGLAVKWSVVPATVFSAAALVKGPLVAPDLPEGTKWADEEPTPACGAQSSADRPSHLAEDRT